MREIAAGVHHARGTCRMGRADDPDAVLDAVARVRGIAGLRVADASIMSGEKIAAALRRDRAQGTTALAATAARRAEQERSSSLAP